MVGTVGARWVWVATEDPWGAGEVGFWGPSSGERTLCLEVDAGD